MAISVLGCIDSTERPTQRGAGPEKSRGMRSLACLAQGFHLQILVTLVPGIRHFPGFLGPSDGV